MRANPTLKARTTNLSNQPAKSLRERREEAVSRMKAAHHRLQSGDLTADKQDELEEQFREADELIQAIDSELRAHK